MIEQVQVACEEEMGLELARRARRYPQKARQLGIPVSTATLGDVRRNGSARTPHLARQPVQFLPRKPRRSLINSQSQLMPLLPHLQLPKVPHTRASAAHWPPADSRELTAESFILPASRGRRRRPLSWRHRSPARWRRRGRPRWSGTSCSRPLRRPSLWPPGTSRPARCRGAPLVL